MEEQGQSIATAAERPLSGVRVIDITGHLAGPFATEILGYLGADVIHIDSPPAASPTPLRHKGEKVTERDGRHWMLLRNKRNMCLDLKKTEDRTVFYDLVRKADIVFDNLRVGALERLCIDYDKLKTINPRIISCSVTGFGSKGPWAEVGAYDLTVQALGGVMAFTGAGDGVPVRWGVPVGDIAASLYAVMGVFAALEDLARTGKGQRIDISMFDCQLALHTFRVPQSFGAGKEFTAPSPRRGGAGVVPYGHFACANGTWVVIGAGLNYWRSFCKVIGAPELIDDERFRTNELRQRNQAQLDALLETYFLRESASTWEQRFMAAKVPVGKVNTIREAFEQPQAVARQMSVTFVTPGGQEIRMGASPIKFFGEDAFAHKPPSPRGGDTERILAELADHTPKEFDKPLAASATRKKIAQLAPVEGPLAGTLVLELCGEEPSGSLGTQILADLGATVLKIERPPEQDVHAFKVPSSDEALPGDIAFFCGLSRNKRSMCLNLKHEEGRAVFHNLVRIADVFLDNYRPGVTARLGADYASLKAVNPNLICCSVTGFGHTGPWSHLPAYDSTILAQGGGMSQTGTGNPPVRWGNPIGGIGGALYGVVGLLAALRWQRHGRHGGAWLDIAMLDTALAMNAYRIPPALDGTPYGPEPMRGGSGSVPYGPFKCGDGRWFVVGITSKPTWFWSKTCEILGHSEWADDPRFSIQEQRQVNENLVNSMVTEALQARSSDEWQRAFVAAGIPSGKVNTIPEAFQHPHVALRDMLVGFKNSTVGNRVKVAGNPIKMSMHGFAGFESPPGFGEHTELILKTLLNLSAEECAQLRSKRAAWWPTEGRVYERPSML